MSFLAEARHARLNFVEDRRLVKMAGAPLGNAAAKHQLGTLIEAGLNETGHFGEVLIVDQRANVGAVLKGIADLHLA